MKKPHQQNKKTDQTLDLAIHLITPPESAPPGALAQVKLICEELDLVHSSDFLVQLLTDEEWFELHWYLEQYWQWPYEQFSTRARRVEALLIEIGKRLYAAIFGSQEASTLFQHWLTQERTFQQISIVSELSQALHLPWELLHNGQDFLALHKAPEIVIARRLLPHEKTLSHTSTPPLRIAIITARPEGLGFIDPRSIVRELLDEVQEYKDAGLIELEILRPPTFAHLRQRLQQKDRPIHILHFDGHGGFQKGQGFLAFEKASGFLDAVTARDLARIFRRTNIQLVMLTACQSAMGSADDAFSSVAAQLIHEGIPVVVAMSASLLVASAIRYTEAFYHEIALGTPTGLAHLRACRVMHDSPERHLAAISREVVGIPVKLQDWWLPHLYQQHSVAFQASQETVKPIVNPSYPIVAYPYLPPKPLYGFFGRAYELLLIERSLTQGKLIFIHGFSGNGKTALVREAIDWFLRTDMYVHATFFSFTREKSELSLDHDEIYRRLKQLKTQPNSSHLIVIDDIDVLRHHQKNAPEEELYQRFIQLLLDLSQMGNSVVITSQSPFIAGTPKQIRSLSLQGLYDVDAYKLALCLFTELHIDHTAFSYQAIQALLHQLNYHPMAIQMIIPMLQQQSIRDVCFRLTEVLAELGDIQTASNTSSPLEQLDFFIQHLSEETRAILPRLRYFQGGGYEDAILQVAQLTQNEWIPIRTDLEHMGLLIVENIHKNFLIPFIHFHTFLIPYIIHIYHNNDVSLFNGYFDYYLSLLGEVYYQSIQHPEIMQILLEREIPNLQSFFAAFLTKHNLSDLSELYGALNTRFFIRMEKKWKITLLEQFLDEITTSQDDNALMINWDEAIKQGLNNLSQRDIVAATQYFVALYTKMKKLREQDKSDSTTEKYIQILIGLARCSKFERKLTAAEDLLQEGLRLIEQLFTTSPSLPNLTSLKEVLQIELYEVVLLQGKPIQAEPTNQGDGSLVQAENQYYQAHYLLNAGRLAQAQNEYTVAEVYYKSALALGLRFSDIDLQEAAWHQMGRAAELQERWEEAEENYRHSLMLAISQNNIYGASQACNQLATVTHKAGRYEQAESWYKQALQYDEEIAPGSPIHARHLSNYGALLWHKAQNTSEDSSTLLLAARGYAEQALTLRKNLPLGEEIWMTFEILAGIAEMADQPEEAKQYRRQARESYAAYPAHRLWIEQRFRPLLLEIAESAEGNQEMRLRIEQLLPELEQAGWHITDTVHRIWAGERDWHVLADSQLQINSLFILMILEMLQRKTDKGT